MTLALARRFWHISAAALAGSRLHGSYSSLGQAASRQTQREWEVFVMLDLVWLDLDSTVHVYLHPLESLSSCAIHFIVVLYTIDVTLRYCMRKCIIVNKPRQFVNYAESC